MFVRLAAASLLVSLIGGACTHVSTVRLQDEAIAVGPGLRPLAAVQANATTAYLLFIPIPGNVDLDRVVNQMLVTTAKTIGADKIANLQFSVTPDGGVWALRKLLGWRSARASGIAVQVVGPAADPNADDGPEPNAALAEPVRTADRARRPCRPRPAGPATESGPARRGESRAARR